MRTKIVYVLVSTDKDFYLEQAYVSMYSAKYYMPDAHIALLVDRLTEESFIGKRKDMLRYVDELVVVDLDRSLKGQKRSRLLKTSVRLHISGDYLFVDCDTIIARPLYEIDRVDTDIAACWDTHALFKDNPYRDMCIAHAKILGYNIASEDIYYNSGVTYVKDNERTRSFYQKWHENYINGYAKGISMDQPSFAITNIEKNHFIRSLADNWNCELKHGIHYLREAKIVHYLGTNKIRGELAPLFIMNDPRVLWEIKQSGQISNAIIEVIKDPFKGIAKVTHCFAGKDLLFFRTAVFSFLRDQYYMRPWLFSFFSLQIRLISAFSSVLGKMQRAIDKDLLILFKHRG